MTEAKLLDLILRYHEFTGVPFPLDDKPIHFIKLNATPSPSKQALDEIDGIALRTFLDEKFGCRCNARPVPHFEDGLDIIDVQKAICQHFSGTRGLTPLQWFTTPNPLLGNMIPIEMIKDTRYRDKLCKWIVTQIDDNNLPTLEPIPHTKVNDHMVGGNTFDADCLQNPEDVK